MLEYFTKQLKGKMMWAYNVTYFQQKQMKKSIDKNTKLILFDSFISDNFSDPSWIKALAKGYKAYGDMDSTLDDIRNLVKYGVVTINYDGMDPSALVVPLRLCWHTPPIPLLQTRINESEDKGEDEGEDDVTARGMKHFIPGIPLEFRKNTKFDFEISFDLPGQELKLSKNTRIGIVILCDVELEGAEDDR